MKHLNYYKTFEKLTDNDINKLNRNHIYDLKQEISNEKDKFEDYYKYELYLLSKKISDKIGISEDILEIDLNILKDYTIRDYIRIISPGFEFILASDGTYRKTRGSFLDNETQKKSDIIDYIRNEFENDSETQREISSTLKSIIEKSKRLIELNKQLKEIESDFSSKEDIVKKELLDYIIDNDITINMTYEEVVNSPNRLKYKDNSRHWNIQNIKKGSGVSVTFEFKDGFYKIRLIGISSLGRYRIANYNSDRNKKTILYTSRNEEVRPIFRALYRTGVLASEGFKKVSEEFINTELKHLKKYEEFNDYRGLLK